MATTDVPTTITAWQSATQSHGLMNASIHERDHCLSASKMSFIQFLLLRTIWAKRRSPSEFQQDLQSRHWVTKAQLSQSRDHLRKGDYFLSYLDSIENSSAAPSMNEPSVHSDLGTFSLVRYYQMICMRDKGPSLPDTSSTSKLNFSPIMTRSRVRPAQSLRNPSTPSKSKGSAQKQLASSRSGSDLSEDNDSDDPAEFASLKSLSSLSLPDISALHMSPISPDTGEFANLGVIEDEQIVNTALLLYLNALTIHEFGDVEWTLARKAFSVQTNTASGVRYKVFEARVDGFLRERRTGQALAIIEVKPHLRYGSSGSSRDIHMQETGQMTAWICQEPPSLKSGEECSRLLISQDRHEVYLTFGTFDDAYVSFVQGKYDQNRAPLKKKGIFGAAKSSSSSSTTQPEPFLHMTEYGPFNLSNKKHMEMLGAFVLAYTIKARTKF